ncbi:MAG: undecaprenyl-phosphate glucose phosphotransferase [Cyclobacteriaceae bacterium]|nr:undecaprenyl-phosphate glucose phosphotransferase [Cyclobacteriaceae bacterium]
MQNIGYSKYQKTLSILTDIAILNVSYFSIYIYHFNSLNAFAQSRYFELLLFYNIAWFFSVNALKVYDISRTNSTEDTVKRLLNALLLFLILIFAFLGLKGILYNKYLIFQSYVLTAFLLTISNITVIALLKNYRRKGYNFRNVLIAGYGEIAIDLKEYLMNNPQLGYKLLGIFDDKSDSNEIKGNIKSIEKFCAESVIHEIYCCLPYIEPRQVRRLIKFSENNFIKVGIIPDIRGFPGKNVEVSLYDFIPVLNFRPGPLEDQFNAFIKRSFDLLLSILVLVCILSWLFPLFAIFIKLESPGPALFIQRRTGRGNKSFRCYKFRTMHVNKDANQKQATRDDARITRFGRFLRRTNLDEMPQFFNVLKGEMSVVGPRPHMLKHTEEFTLAVEKFMLRHYVKPGITGLAQIKGYRGETNTYEKLKNRVKLDRFYVANWSLFFDIRIILLTTYSMLKGDKNAF